MVEAEVSRGLIQDIADLREVAPAVHGSRGAHLGCGDWCDSRRARPSHRERRLRRVVRHAREQVLSELRKVVMAGGSERPVTQVSFPAAAVTTEEDVPAGHGAMTAGTQRLKVLCQHLCRGARTRRQAWVRHGVRKHLVKPEEGKRLGEQISSGVNKSKSDALTFNAGMYAVDSHSASVSARGLYRAWGTVAGLETFFLIDTGSTINAISSAFVSKHQLASKQLSKPLTVTLADGSSKTGTARYLPRARWSLAGGDYYDACDLIITDLATYDVILGMPWLRERSVSLLPDNWVSIGVTEEGIAEPYLFQATGAPAAAGEATLLAISAQVAKEVLEEADAQVLLFFVSTSEPEDAESGGVRIQCADPVERGEVEQLLEEFADIAPHQLPAGLPPIRGHEHAINLTPGATPPYRSPMRIPLLMLQKLREKIQELVRTGRLVPSKSPYGAPVFLVAKGVPKEGCEQEWRMVTDYRALNAITVKDRTMMPNIQELLDQLREAKYFSSLDAHSGYHQIRLQAGDEDKTAITTPFGHYNFTVMPFGLVNAGATYSAMMTDLLREKLYGSVVSYLDDTLVFSKTFREHISTLREVFKVYRDNKIYLKPSKVVLAAAEISFLGWIIGDGMVRPDPSKVKAVSEWPRPASAHDVQSFLGLVNWFHKMLPGFAALAAPLYELTKKKAAWHWENVHESAFLELKRLLCSAPGLRIADPAKAYIVAADASGEAIGAVLLQEHQEVLHPVAFLSRKLSALEHRLPTHDREMLAVITALQRWRPYLYGAVNTTVWTDHNPLTHFATQPKLSMKQVRWLDVFAEFQARMVYRKGAAMSGPDALSRAVHGEDPRRSEQHDVFQAHIASAEQMFALRASMVGAAEGWEQALASAVKGDQFFGPIVNKLSLASAGASKGWPGVRYELIEGLLYLRAKPGATRRLCLPAKGSFRLEMLREAHDSAMAAHRGETATIERMQRDFFFKGMAKFTRQFVSSCGACQRSKAEHSRKRGLLVPLAVTSVPYSELAMDFVGGFPAVAGLDQVLVVVDRCTRAGSFIPCKSNASAVEVARLFFENIVRRFGMPRVVVSDRDTKFTGKFWTELFRLAGSRLDMSTADHPQSDGLTERLNRTLVEMLRALVGHDQGDWVEKLAAVEFAYNSTAHSATGSPPFKLLYGFMPAAPAGIWSNNGGEPDSRVEATARFVRTQKAAWVVASDAVLAGQSKMAAIADKARVDAHFKVGDLVLIDADALMTPVERARPRLKLRALAVGPLAVTALVGPNAVRVKLPAGSRAHDVVNISKLRPFTANSMPGREVEKPPQVIGTDGDLEDVVRDIVAHKGSGQSRLFLTRWEGEEDCDATWQSAGSFIDSDGGVTKQFADYCVRHSFPLPTAV